MNEKKQLKFGARVYRVGPRLLIKQTVLRGSPPEYVVDGSKERHVKFNDDAEIATAIRLAIEGKLMDGA